MPDDMFQRGGRMIERVRATSLSHPIVYRRAGQPDLAINATIDSSEVETVTEGGLGIIRRMRDFLVATADLEDNGVLFKPEDGDTISETVDGLTTDWRVTRLDGQPAWMFDDYTDQRIRIHAERK